MKKILLSLATVSLLIAPMVVFAAAPSRTAPDLDICCGPTSVVIYLMNWLFVILLIVAALALIIAAYFFVTAAGDPDKVKKARDFVLYALIGVLVAFSAKGLVALVGKIVE